jgi:hypothetical protein
MRRRTAHLGCGGNPAHAESASELPSVMVRAGRAVARQFGQRLALDHRRRFLSRTFSTAFRDDELLVEIAVSALPARTGTCFFEIAVAQRFRPDGRGSDTIECCTVASVAERMTWLVPAVVSGCCAVAVFPKGYLVHHLFEGAEVGRRRREFGRSGFPKGCYRAGCIDKWPRNLPRLPLVRPACKPSKRRAMRNSLSGPRGKPPWKPSGRRLAMPAMRPAKLKSEKADRVTNRHRGDRSLR